MARVSVSKSINITFSEEEKQKIQEVYNLFYDIRHDLFMEDDDSEIYWMLDGVVDGMNQFMKETNCTDLYTTYQKMKNYVEKQS